MLVVESDVEGDRVQGAVVRVCFLSFPERIVLLHPAGAENVQSDAEKRREQDVGQSHRAARPPDQEVAGRDGEEVEHDPLVHEGLAETNRPKDLDDWE